MSKERQVFAAILTALFFATLVSATFSVATVDATSLITSARPAMPKAAANGKITFSSKRDGNPEIYLMDADGANQTRITNNPAYDDQPRLSPDGSKILFISDRDGNFEIYSMNTAGSSVSRLTNNPAGDGFPAWSPDGAKIAFVNGDLRDPSTFEIYSMNADGSNRTRLTNNPLIDAVPAWSPDGTKIAFMSGNSLFDPNGFEIYVMNADGSNRTRLTNNTIADGQASWSPDGTKILFASGDAMNPSGIEIYTMNANGSNRTQITNNSVTDGFPAWSPDGTKIVFASGSVSDETGVEIYSMNANGSNQTKLTNNSALDWFPDWGTAPATNPIDDATTFVTQLYRDFLNREPDADGLAYWTHQITQCGSNAQCIHDQRVGVADAFFFEDEFQKTGAYIYRIYRTGLGVRPTYAQFNADRGLVVAGPGLEQSKLAYAKTFVGRAAFIALYPQAQTAAQFVDALLNRIQQNSGVDLSAQRNALISLYDGTDNGRAAILKQVAETQAVIDAEYNSSFVLMEYFGYLRRDPDQGGYDFWLGKVNSFPLRNVAIQQAMACSFITSAEYQLRFGSAVTHTNRECPQ
ncbi:MAG: DUF4214 domain-containing protein [Pyrinomonadaceae bacterium]